MPWLGFTDALHAVSHHGGKAASKAKQTKMLAWIAEQIARVFNPNQLVVRFAVAKKFLPLVKSGASVQLVTTEGGHVIPATVRVQDDSADPTIDFTVFEAVIDPTFRTDEIRVGDNGHVRIAGAGK